MTKRLVFMIILTGIQPFRVVLDSTETKYYPKKRSRIVLMIYMQSGKIFYILEK
jgi:hypothetical protein